MGTASGVNNSGSRAGLWLRVAGTLLTLGLLAWLLSQQGWERIAGSFKLIPTWRLWVALGLTLLSRLAVVMRWHVLLRSTSERATIANSMRITFAGLFASNFLPTTVGGDVVRLAGAVQVGFRPAVSAATLVVDRLIGMAGMIVMLPWGIGPFLNNLPALRSGLLAESAWLPAWLVPLRQLFARQVQRFFRTFALWQNRPKDLLVSFGFTLLYMVFKFSAVWLMLDGMTSTRPGSGQTMPWLLVAGVWSLVYFVTLLPVSINGYGLQEVSVTLLYATLGGISQEAAVTIALLIRTLEMAASLPGALFAPGILAARRAQQAEVQSHGTRG
jgi:glycosyltransferase 2 family protein